MAALHRKAAAVEREREREREGEREREREREREGERGRERGRETRQIVGTTSASCKVHNLREGASRV